MVFKFELMEKVKDRITGFQGVITSRTQWLSGCVRYSVTSKKRTPEGKEISDVIDEQQLISVEKPKNVKTRNAGGPKPAIQQFKVPVAR